MGTRSPDAAHRRDRVLVRRDLAPSPAPPPAPPNGAPSRRNAGWLLHDALNNATPQIFDTVDRGRRREARSQRRGDRGRQGKAGARSRTAFTDWIWTDPDRTDRLARIYNDRFNNLVPRHFDGRHLTLPGASNIIRLYDHQKRVIWRIVSAGSTYIAHTVGAGKSYAIAAAIMEQKRLGLINKAMLVVPGHCLAQVSREFLQLYPTARILVADETNFVKDEAFPLPGARGDGELGRDDHHPLGVPLHPGAVRLRARR